MVGNFAYPPTADAALHLVGDVLPAIRRRGCDPEVRLVGAAPSAAIRALAADPRVHVTGEVPAVEPWLDAADVVLVPLRVGGGVKVKVLEALARGRPVVTTPVGAQGLSAAAARGVIVAADAEGLAERTATLLRDPLARVAAADAARRAAATLPRWNDAAAALLACWAEAAGRGAASWRAAAGAPALIAS